MYKTNKGFTLIELLAVIAILSIIIVIVMPAITSSSTATKNKAYETKVTLIEDAAVMYGQDNYGKIINQTSGTCSKFTVNTTTAVCEIDVKKLVPNYLASETGTANKHISDPRTTGAYLDNNKVTITINRTTKTVTAII